ncbi:R8 protein [Sporothrix curviconia]|uniref:R8 protein n=1 Tax=Sporothrix curviconia TaxID=1260050 RepID=A0ABP0CCA3_9PEZI
MFYSTEILCDKRYALSTVWRAGNTAIGARTTGLHRKAVLEVSVEKTCGTIKDPPGAPIALRLQGTLLYGTARIFQEQCRYVLNDSEKTQRAMSKLYNGMLDDKLDKNAGKAKSVQIILPNDPSFDLDLFQLPPFSFDEPIDGSFFSQDRQASWTSLSLKSRSSQNTQLPQLMLDADSSAGGSYAGGGFRYSASGASVMPDSPTPLAQRFNFQDEDNLLLDVGLFIDDNGNIIEEETRTEPQLPVFPPRPAKVSSDNVVPMIVDDDDIFNPDPAIPATLAGNSRNKALLESSGINPSLITHTPSSPSTLSPSTVVSRQAHHRVTRAKVNFIDDVTQIPLSDYFRFVTNYSEDMEKVAEKKSLARAARRAHDTTLHRQVAQAFTFGRGIFCVANEVGAQYPEHPLAEMFSGDTLAESILGESLTRAKRRRVDLAEPSTPIARGNRGINLDGFEDEQDIELGRMPGSALSDNPSLALNRHSSALPGSSAHGSVQRSASAVRQHADGRLSSAGFPDSPSFFERYSDGDIQLPPQFQSNGGNPFLPSVSSIGAAAGGGGGFVARTGTAVASNAQEDGQKKKNGSDKVGEELRNVSVFYDLVRNVAADEGLARPELSSTYRWVEFGDVVSPFRTNRAAVVGAFMSLLTLATARKLRIHQDEVEGSAIIDRDIFIGTKPKKPVDRKGKGKMKDKKKSKKRSIREISQDNTSDGIDELASDQIFPSPMLPHKSFFLSSELSNNELIGAA